MLMGKSVKSDFDDFFRNVSIFSEISKKFRRKKTFFGCTKKYFSSRKNNLFDPNFRQHFSQHLLHENWKFQGKPITGRYRDLLPLTLESRPIFVPNGYSFVEANHIASARFRLYFQIYPLGYPLGQTLWTWLSITTDAITPTFCESARIERISSRYPNVANQLQLRISSKLVNQLALPWR